MNRPDDPILNACLAELLGGQSPPDLSARILQTWAERQANGRPTLAGPLDESPLAPPLAPPLEPLAPPVQLASTLRESAAGAFSARNSHSRVGASPSRHWRNWSVVVASLALLAIAVVAVRKPRDGATNIAQQPNTVGQKAGGQKSVQKVEKSKVPNRSSKNLPSSPTTGSSVPATPARTNPAPGSPASSGDSSDKKAPSAAALAEVRPGPAKPDTASSRAPSSPSRAPSDAPSKPASDKTQIVAFIDAALRTAWREQGASPSPPATDAEWCRRTYLRLIGRIPTVEELQRFATDKSADKRSRLVDQLVEGEAYVEEYAGHWSSLLSNALVGRSGGSAEDGAKIREGLQQFLRNAFYRNKPYDQLVYELLTATGSNHPSDADYNAAVNFLLANQNDKATLATARVARVFLGSQLHCAQCHSHPSNDWKQDQFWQLNAFFRQMQVERDSRTGGQRLVNRDFSGEGTAGDGEIYFEQRDGRVKVAFPKFIDGSAPPRSGRMTEVDRRSELAQRVVRSENLGRAAVNRVWAHFFGYGFTRPIDDIGPHNSPSHPELLQRLTDEFVAHGYDVRQLMKWVAASEAFGLSSRIGARNVVDAPDAGATPLFSRYYPRPMQAEELFQSLQLLASARKKTLTPAERERARQTFLGQVARNMGDDEGGEEQMLPGIPQSLLMMNGELTRRAISPSHESMLGRVSESGMTTDAKIEHLFLASLARKPSKKELVAAQSLIAASGASSLQGLQDLWWALLNSNEFILDH